MKAQITIIMNDDWWSVTGGISRFIQEVAPRLSRTFKIHIIATRSRNGVSHRTIHPQLEVSQFPNYPSPPFFPDLKYPKFTPELGECLEKSDLVFMQNADMPITILRARRRKKPIVFYLHALDWLRGHRYVLLRKGQWVAPLLRRYFAYWYNRADHLCVPSEGLREPLREAGIHTPTTCVPAGIDGRRFLPEENKEAVKQRLGLGTNTVIGYAGRMWREKKLDSLVRIFRELSRYRKDLTLLLVGEGPERYVRSFRSLPGVIHVGYQANVVSYLQAMDIYCQPLASFETSSLSTMEAMACGLPVVVGRLGCPGEYIEHGETGFLIDPPDDETLFISRLRELIDDPEKRSLMGQKARRAILQIFDWDKTASILGNVFEGCLHEWEPSRF